MNFWLCIAIFIFETFNGAEAKIRGQVKKYVLKTAGPGIVPWKELCCGFTAASCGFKCSELNMNGFCCTAYSVTTDGSCLLYDSDPENYLATTTASSSTTDPILYTVNGSPKCQVVFMTGGAVSGSFKNFVEVYSPNGGCSHSLAPLPTGVGDHILVILGKDILTCNGYCDSCNNWNRNCWKYDIAANQWSVLTVSPNNHYRYAPGQVYNNKLYIVDIANGETYNPATNSWTTGLTLPINIGQGTCMVQYKDTFVAFGGDANKQIVQQYNHTTGLWKTLPNLIYGANFHDCILLPNTDGKALIVGVDSCCSTNVQYANVYDLVTLAQTNLPAPSVLRGWGTNLVALGSRVFVLNGWTWSANVPTVEEFHALNNSWTKITAPLITPRHRSRTISVPASWFSNFTGGCKGVM